MLPDWLRFTALLAVAALTVKASGGVRGHPEEELTLHCGDRRRSGGTVVFWYSPLGYVHPQDPLSSQDPVHMDHNGSLVISNSSILHSGLFYCLLWRQKGTTVRQYQLHVASFGVKQKVRVPEIRPLQDEDEPEDQTERRMEIRSELVPEGRRKSRRPCVITEEPQGGSEVVPPLEEPDDGPAVQSRDGGTAGASDGRLVAAVASSVLLTFVVGFSSGALARTQVLRCVAAVTLQLRFPGQQTRRANATDRRSEVAAVTVAYENRALEMKEVEQVGRDDSWASTLPPPAKPQRSFRYKRDENEAAAYLEGCDYVRTVGEHREGREVEEESEEWRRSEEEASSSFLLKDGGSSSETKDDMEERDEGGREEKDEGSRAQEKRGIRGEECGGSGVEVDGWSREAENRGRGEDAQSREGDGLSREEGDDAGETCRFSQTVDEGNQTGREDKERRAEEREDEEGDEGADSSGESDQSSDGQVSHPLPRPACRVIRLYQYDEDGHRYGHLSDAPDEASHPAPRLKQRSLSLTRLNAIMAAAMAFPLDARGDSEKPGFHMDI